MADAVLKSLRLAGKMRLVDYSQDSLTVAGMNLLCRQDSLQFFRKVT